MREIVASMFLSLDGVMESPADWHLPYWSGEMGEVVGGQMAESDAMLLGRESRAFGTGVVALTYRLPQGAMENSR
jgi:hypothetical protein